MAITPTYPIPISNGIFAHCTRIGPALWTFVWLIDHVTKEMPGADGNADGLVYGGRPIHARAIAADLGKATRTVHEHLERLVAGGYVRRAVAQKGQSAGYAVLRSKKWNRFAPQATCLIGPEESKPEDTSRKSADLPRGNTVWVRGNPRYPRGNPLPIKETIQDNTQLLLRAAPPVPSEPDQGGSRGSDLDKEKSGFKLEPPEPLVLDGRKIAAKQMAEDLAECWAYYREKLKRSSTYEFSKTRRSFGEQGLHACMRLASEMGSVSPREDAVKFLKLAIDHLTREPFHNGKNDTHVKHLDWDTLFDGKKMPCPQKLTEYWLNPERWGE